MNPLYFGSMNGGNLTVILVLLVWSLFWKGYALWTAAHRREKMWFVAMLVINTAGILEIVYLFGFVKKKWSDVTALFHRLIASITKAGDRPEPQV